jgi:hypothetical protein
VLRDDVGKFIAACNDPIIYEVSDGAVAFTMRSSLHSCATCAICLLKMEKPPLRRCG